MIGMYQDIDKSLWKSCQVTQNPSKQVRYSYMLPASTLIWNISFVCEETRLMFNLSKCIMNK